LSLVLVVRRRGRGSWCCLSLGLFAARTAHRSAEESRLLLLCHRGLCRLRRWGRAFGRYRLLWRLLIDRWLLKAAAATGLIAVAAVRTLVAVAAAISAVTLLAFVTVAIRPPVVAIAMFSATRSVSIVAVAAEILAAIAPVVAVIALVVTAVVAVVLAIIVEAVSALIVALLAIIAVLVVIEIALRLLEWLLLRRLAQVARLLQLNSELVAIVVAEFVAIVTVRAGEIVRLSGAAAERIHAALGHLLAVAQDDAIVVLGMLQIILSKYRIARGQRVSRQRDILFGDVRGRATDFYIRSRALKAAHQGVLRFAVVVIPTATATVLLSLPHGLPFTLVNIFAIRARPSMMPRTLDPPIQFKITILKATHSPCEPQAPALARMFRAKSQ
jgi:hypothetical protein